MQVQRNFSVRGTLLALVAIACVAPWSRSATAAGQTQLVLVGEGGQAAMLFQPWMQVLGKAGIESVRFRSAKPNDKVGVQVHGTEGNRLYIVTGIVRGTDELLLPPGRFRRRDAGRLARWLDELAEQGPADQREQKAAFGLRASQFARIHDDLAQPILFSTKGLSRRDAVARISRQLTFPIRSDAQTGAALQEDEIAEELLGLSCGTVLAYVLRPMGYCLVPRLEGPRTTYAIVKARPEMEVWPVGWESEQPSRDLLPTLYEFHNVNIEGVAASTALQAIGKLLGVPVLIDHNALARHGVDPDKVLVSHPRSRTTYSLALRKILFQARLKSEVRVDEAEKPFLWVTTVKPV